MISLIRWIGALSGIGIALVTVVMLPLWLFKEAWYRGGRLLGGRLPDFTLHPPLDSLASYPPFSWRGLPIPLPPGNDWVVSTSLTMITALMIILALLYALVSTNARIKAACGYKAKPVGDGHPYQLYIDGLARANGLGRIELRFVPVGGIIAFVLSAPFRPHVVVVSNGVLDMPQPMARWVLAHEVAHVYHGDTQSSSLWLLAMRSIRLFDSLRHKIMNLIIRIIHALPILSLLTHPVFLVFRLLSWIGRLGRWVGNTLFLVFDRYASRKMEFRADRFAADIEGPGPGIELFQRLTADFEPSFNLFATHPSHKRRIKALGGNVTGEPRGGGVMGETRSQ